MQVNTEQTNTQQMLEHNQKKKDRQFAGSLQRDLVDLVCGKDGKLNIDPRESTILNIKNIASGPSGMSPVEYIFTQSGAMIESDVDAQILIKLKFIEKVDCCQISFYDPKNDSPQSSNARLVKIFVNRNDLDFSDLDSVPPAIELELPFEYENAFKTNLAGSKFGRVSSIQILIDDNFDTDFSKIGRITIEGFYTPTYEYK